MKNKPSSLKPVLFLFAIGVLMAPIGCSEDEKQSGTENSSVKADGQYKIELIFEPEIVNFDSSVDYTSPTNLDQSERLKESKITEPLFR